MRLLNSGRSLRRKQGQRGFTLMEMIATLAVLTILVTGVAMLVQPAVNVYRSSTDNSRGSVICNNVLNILSSEFMYATRIELTGKWSDAEIEGASGADYTSPIYDKMHFKNELTDGEESGIVTLKVADGSGTISLGEEFYMGMTVQVGLEAEKANVLKINIAAFDRTGRLIGRQHRSVKLLNTVVSVPGGS